MGTNQMIDISIVIPLYNEESVFSELYKRLNKSIEKLTENYEYIFINDGSTDNTLNLLKDYSLNDCKLKFISFSRNFGHQNAIYAGIKHAEGKVIIIMDGGLAGPS